MLDDYLKVVHIHAGVTGEGIISIMESCIVKAEMCAQQDKRLWIFFDEFNTTSNIGLLKEIMCERTLLGVELPSNITFLGACNPRRKKTNKLIENDDAHIGLRKNCYEIQKSLWAGADQSLLHNVVPIPETMLEYIWDYGYLNESTESAYIKAMLKTCRDLSSNPSIFNLTVDLLVNSQSHIRNLEDVSSVSLRDIARFCRLYNWFLDFLCKYPENSDHRIRRASFIALLLCYYF